MELLKVVDRFTVVYPVDVRSESTVESNVAMPYLSKPPSSSSVRLGPDNSFRHDWRAS